MNKSTLIILIVLVVGAGIYFYTMGDRVPAGSSLLQGNSATLPDNVAAEVLALLNQIKSLEIDPTVFDEPVYQTLVDYSVPIPPQNVGRVNPFAPVR
jgi:hypothetical protein